MSGLKNVILLPSVVQMALRLPSQCWLDSVHGQKIIEVICLRWKCSLQVMNTFICLLGIYLNLENIQRFKHLSMKHKQNVSLKKNAQSVVYYILITLVKINITF